MEKKKKKRMKEKKEYRSEILEIGVRQKRDCCKISQRLGTGIHIYAKVTCSIFHRMLYLKKEKGQKKVRYRGGTTRICVV